MIIITTEQGLVRPENWTDVEQLPGFTPSLDPELHELDSIFGNYYFDEEVHCGLSVCNQPHNRGYLVKTKTGPVTNIGKDCGKKHFGVDFEILHKQFDRSSSEAMMREQLEGFSLRLDNLEVSVQDIRQMEKGADWLHKKITALTSVGGDVPEPVVRHLFNMTRAGSGRLTKARPATDAETEAARATGAKISNPYLIDEVVGVITGFEALYAEYNLKKLLIHDVGEKVKVFKGLNIDTMSYADLRSWSKWESGLEGVMNKAREGVAHGRRLMERRNLEQFNQVLSPADADQFHRFLKTI